MNTITKQRRPRITKGQVVSSTSKQTYALIKTALDNGNKLVQSYNPLSYRNLGRSVVTI